MKVFAKKGIATIQKWWSYYAIFTLAYFIVDLVGIIVMLVAWKVFGFNPMGLWGWTFFLFVIMSLPQLLFGFLPAFIYNRYGLGWQLVLPSVILLAVNVVFLLCFGEGSGNLIFYGWIPTLSACGPFSLFLDSSLFHVFHHCGQFFFIHYLQDLILAPLTYLAITYASAFIFEKRTTGQKNTDVQ